jgi:hypothetical protein
MRPYTQEPGQLHALPRLPRLVALALLLTSCTRAQSHDEAPAADSPAVGAGASTAVADSLPAAPAAAPPTNPAPPSRSDSGSASRPPARETRGATPGPGAGADSAMTVREVLAADVRVGQEVRVTGRCTGYSERATLGAPPVSRSDWLLEGDGATVFVNGSLPQGCTVTGGSTATTTIRARVAEDTLRALGGRPPAPRRYLVRLGS